MAVVRVGPHFLKMLDDEGRRVIVRMSAIQQACDYDECQRETFLTVAGRTIPVRIPLDELEYALCEPHAVIQTEACGRKSSRRLD